LEEQIAELDRPKYKTKQDSHRPQTPPPVLPSAWEVTLSARKVVPCVRCLQLVLLCTVYSQAQGCASAKRRRRTTLAFEQILRQP